MLEQMSVWDSFSRANATSSGGRCRHLPLQGKAELVSTLHSSLSTQRQRRHSQSTALIHNIFIY
ncbi:MAG: hypothetical protein ACI4RP_07785 [Acutalibacteraceae bacterium]